MCCAGIGSGINNTNELKELSYEEAMASMDKTKWEALVDCVHEQMHKNDVWEVVDKDNIPPGADIIDSTWVMKKKSNGEYWARLAARGFKQTQGKLFVHHDISSVVVHDVTVRIMLVLMLMGNMEAHLVDVNGAFLLGEFKLDEKILMRIPHGFEKFYLQGGLLF